MKRREFITLLGGAGAWPLAARGQQRKVPTIGVLVAEASGLEQFWRLFREDMAKLGYVEGQNIRYEFRSDQGQISRASTLAAELVRFNVDLIVTWFTPAAQAAKAATHDIPIVMALTGDPLANGLVESLSRPGGNVTGMSGVNAQLGGKCVELMREMLPLAHRMRRREFITLLGGVAAWPIAARAQQDERIRRIGVLIAGLTQNDSEGQLRIAAFRQGLQNLGWIEGRNVHIEERWPGGNAERLQSFAAELVGMRPDAIFAGNEAATMALHRTASTLPIVFAQVSDPVANGLVASPARPGGNLTGFALWEYGFATKWGELLREIAPRTARVGVIYDPANVMQRQLPDLERSLSPSVHLVALSVSSRSDLENAIERIANEPNSALIVFPGLFAVAHRDLIITLAVKHSLPLLYPYRYFAAAGGLLSYGPDLIDQCRLAAGYIDRLLKGEKPADLPVQFPTKYMLVINLNTAKALGLTVPDTLIARADEVIE